MNSVLSLNTQAILLLTAPLLTGSTESSQELLTPGEYKRLVRLLREGNREPADLLGTDSTDLLKQCGDVVDAARLARLLERGFLMSQAVERWQARAIWVVGRLDAAYPARIASRLKENAPAVLYGCGDVILLDTGGLAVVGSRHVDDTLVEYTENVGRLAAGAGYTVVSGGARGIDQAAMRGTLQEGGKVSGVLADSLERAALAREHRDVLMDGRLALISPYDPLAGFNVGNAMQRNKLIYALADAALVVSSDYEKGGTWAGAVEQLDKLAFVPVYVRPAAKGEKGLEALQKKGARVWPEPATAEEFAEALAQPVQPKPSLPEQGDLFSVAREDPVTDFHDTKPIKPQARKPSGGKRSQG
jgi:predicted Rossmann fold nucleotide-binding protein DprA/Smf involved in DNA uptake